VNGPFDVGSTPRATLLSDTFNTDPAGRRAYWEINHCAGSGEAGTPVMARRFRQAP